MVKMKNVINNVIYQVPVIAHSLEEAKQKAQDYPYNTLGNFVIL